jgi:putative ABC transport system substrate-binding protein
MVVLGQGAGMRRREFIGLVGGATAWPLLARGQQLMPVIGFLSSRSPDEAAYVVAAFHSGLKEGGYREGVNIKIEYRWAEGQYARLPELAADLVRNRVAVIASSGGMMAAVAAKQATTTIPIVFTAGDDPVKSGVVASLNRPGGNATGVYNFVSALEAKRFGLLRETVPAARSVVVLLNPKFTTFGIQLNDLQKAAHTAGVPIHVSKATSGDDIDTAFRDLARVPDAALLVGADPFFNGRREQLVTLAAHYKIPTMYELREYTLAGGLMSYGSSLIYAYRQVGIYVARILRGEKPADLPVLQSSKFELVINLKTAKALHLTIPERVLAIADDVIE